jgi:peptidase E
MTTRPRILTIMGSGETAPTMMKHHRDLIARLPGDPLAVVIDTPYGFQENAPELASRAVEYFRQSVGYPIQVAGLGRLKNVDVLTVETGLSLLRRADYVFAGPGSPTYALNQWENTAVPDVLREKLQSGGAVTFASAAALTLGRFTVPVYEIYKVGIEPHWLEGLDVLRTIGLDVAVIPHYDNTEGGHHDTRFCYLGERRLAMLEQELPDGAHVLGVDEHTGVVIDIDADTATVIGNGTITVRVRGESTVFESGVTIPVDVLRDPSRTGSSSAATTTTSRESRPVTESPHVASSLLDEVAKAEASFESALASGDSESAVRSVLELETSIRNWSVDTLQSDAMDRAHAALRSMIVRLGEAAVKGLADPRTAIDPVMNVVLEIRRTVRDEKRYDLSDVLRDRLAEVGIEIRDTPTGPEWHFSPTL